MANFRNDRTPAWVFGVGLSMYDIMALKWNHAAYDPPGLRNLVPQLCSPELVSGYRYFDAQTDDARLVFRVVPNRIPTIASIHANISAAEFPKSCAHPHCTPSPQGRSFCRAG